MAEYNEELRKGLWNRLSTVNGKDKDSYRLDAAGALIEWRSSLKRMASKKKILML